MVLCTILFDYDKKWKNMYKMSSLKSEVSLERFITWGYSFIIIPTSIVCLLCLGLFSPCSGRSIENLAGSLWSSADQAEAGKGDSCRVFVPITETGKGWLLCVEMAGGQGW